MKKLRYKSIKKFHTINECEMPVSKLILQCYGLAILKLLPVHAKIEQMNKCIEDNGKWVSHC